jgi:hypothetical protein
LCRGKGHRQSPTAGEIGEIRHISLEGVNLNANPSNQGCSVEKDSTMIAASKSGGAERQEKSRGFSSVIVFDAPKSA